MTRPPGYERLLLFVSLLAIALYAIADDRLAVLVLGAPVAVLGLRLTRSGSGWSLPKVVAGLLVVGAIANALRTGTADGVDVSDFSEFMVLILLIKCFDRSEPKDDSQLITLCAFLAIGATLLSPALVVGAMLLIFVPIFVVVAMQFQVYAGRSKAAVSAREADAAARRDDTDRAGTSAPAGSVRTRHYLGVTGFSLVMAFVVSAVVFVLVPRGLGRSVFGDWTRNNASSVTGFTDRVQLGGEGVISESTRPVLEVAVIDDDGQPTGGEGELFYLRGAALDAYRGGTWVARPRSQLRQSWQLEANERLTLSGVPRDAETQTIRVQMREPARGATPLFGMWRPITVRMTSPGRLGVSPVDQILQFDPDRGEVLSYEIRSAIDLLAPRDTRSSRTPASFDSQVVADRAAQALAVGEVSPDPAVRPVADDELAARLIERHLQTSFGYTLRMVSPPVGVDPIDWFLTERAAGHCEYFASSMAAMCRSIGINARVVTGYVTAEYDPARGSYLVRESNAHAWVEAEVSPGLWRVFDPTPQAELRDVHVPELGLAARVARFFDSLENAWVSSIIGFDESTRSRLLGVEEASEEDRIADSWFVRALRGDGSRWMKALATGAVAFVATSLVGLGLVFVAGRWGLLRRTGAEPRAWDGHPFYAEALDLLARHDLAKPDAEPLDRFASNRLAALDRALADAASRIARLYYRERFGGVAITPQDRTEARRWIEELGQRLSSVPR